MDTEHSPNDPSSHLEPPEPAKASGEVADSKSPPVEIRRYGDVNGDVYSEHGTNLALGETRVSGGFTFFGAKPKKRKLT
ncbi:MAG: hypothetical protein AAGG44_08130, partial [Planctomycetota bacterium]